MQEFVVPKSIPKIFDIMLNLPKSKGIVSARNLDPLRSLSSNNPTFGGKLPHHSSLQSLAQHRNRLPGLFIPDVGVAHTVVLP